MESFPEFDIDQPPSFGHRTPSVGKIIKKLLAVNPELTIEELIHIMRECTKTQGGGDFGSSQMIDETRAMELVRLSLR